MNYQEKFSAILASSQPESTGEIHEGNYGAIGDGIRSMVVDRILTEAKRMVREGIDTPEERQQIADGACAAIKSVYPQTPDFVLDLVGALLAEALAYASSKLEG